MITTPEFLKLEVIYRFYSVPLRLYCPYCRFRSTHKTKTYHSLKSLGQHIATDHKDSSYPIPVTQVTEIIKILAKSLEIGILPLEEGYLKDKTPVFPQVLRFLDCEDDF